MQKKKKNKNLQNCIKIFFQNISNSEIGENEEPSTIRDRGMKNVRPSKAGAKKRKDDIFALCVIAQITIKRHVCLIIIINLMN